MEEPHLNEIEPSEGHNVEAVHEYFKEYQKQQEELNNELVEGAEEPIEVTFKLTEEQNAQEVADVPFDYLEDDPYLATALEFMYSEDTEQDFNSMDRKMQE